MIDPRKVATLGIGYGALATALLGFVVDAVTPPPTFGGGRGFLPEKKPRRRDDDEVFLICLQ